MTNQINLAVVPEVISSSVETGASSTLIESASSTVDSTATTETSALTESSVAETSITIGSRSTEFTQVSVSTTESLVVPTTTATTTASEEAGPTGFFLIAGEGPALEGKVKSNGDSFTPMVLCDCGSTYDPVRFLVDEIIGELQQDGVTVCTYLQVG
ncbi:hypothetical protein FAGAP_1630 [Fusarium agapanthi]|uniref:Uncharacterized protein n=1 Tax=Fusarium agapanthi TaxID=1803897 RepID=A0A9P5BKP1_9HYPO|nr:hypothetical protein FAGAP_1630 [Fusarium agapanthi]